MVAPTLHAHMRTRPSRTSDTRRASAASLPQHTAEEQILRSTAVVSHKARGLAWGTGGPHADPWAPTTQTSHSSHSHSQQDTLPIRVSDTVEGRPPRRSQPMHHVHGRMCPWVQHGVALHKARRMQSHLSGQARRLPWLPPSCLPQDGLFFGTRISLRPHLHH
jgi:hypothetical protein